MTRVIFNCLSIKKVTSIFSFLSKPGEDKTAISEQTEVLILAGGVSFYNDEPKVHAHVVLGKRDGTAHGGHLIKAIVHPTLEIILTESPAYLHREMDKEGHEL